MTSKITFSAFCAINLVAVILATNAHAQPQDPTQNHPPCGNPKPPLPAIDACNGKKSGDSVSFIGRHNDKISGICTQMDNVLAARPEGGAPHGENGDK
jgi:hypothetical protein